MTTPDAQRWDIRYQHMPRFASFEQPRPFLTENAHWLPEHGLALDIAMGLGGNASFLLAYGLKVIGVDISEVGLNRAKNRSPGLMAVLADLNNFYFLPKSFDVILNFFYLQRDLWPVYAKALKPNGLLFFETLTIEMLEIQPKIEPKYLLKPGELQQAFSTWEILTYWEGWTENETGHRRAVARLIARKMDLLILSNP